MPPRRKLPAPFRRESIDLSRTPRSWIPDLPADRLRKGDTVAGKGTVRSVVHTIEGTSVMTGIEGEELTLHLFEPGAVVRAFSASRT